jgi:hypothetical protein
MGKDKRGFISALIILFIPITGHTLPFLGGEISLKVPQGAAVHWINGISMPLSGGTEFVFDYFGNLIEETLPSISIYDFGSFEFVGVQPVIVQPFLGEFGDDESSFLADVIVTHNQQIEDPSAFGHIDIRSHDDQGGRFDFDLLLFTETQLYDHVTGEFIARNAGNALLSATDVRWSHTAPENYPDRSSNPGGNFYITEPMNLTFINDGGWSTEIRQLLPIGIPEPAVDKLVLFSLLLFPLASRSKRSSIVPSNGHVERNGKQFSFLCFFRLVSPLARMSANSPL